MIGTIFCKSEQPLAYAVDTDIFDLSNLAMSPFFSRPEKEAKRLLSSKKQS